MNLVKLIVAMPIGLALTGCASLPDVVIPYYWTKWEAQVIAARSVWCYQKKDGTRGIVVTPASTVVPVIYSADTAKGKKHTIALKPLDRWFADIDLTVQLTPDGRLKAINATQTGGGGALASAAAGLVQNLGAVARLTIPEVATQSDRVPVDEACNLIKGFVGGDKAMTLTYKASINTSTPDGKLEVATPFQDLDRLLQRISEIGPMTAELKTGKVGVPESPVESEPVGSVKIMLQKQVVREVVVSTGGSEVDRISLIVPTSKPSKLSIPEAALFGKTSFVLELSESGAVTKIGYGRTVGAAAAVTALDSFVKLETPSVKAQLLKAEIDLIAYQQKLAGCLRKPEDCK